MTKMTQTDMELLLERLVNRVNEQDERIKKLEAIVERHCGSYLPHQG
jgi:hypothetical protein